MVRRSRGNDVIRFGHVESEMHLGHVSRVCVIVAQSCLTLATPWTAVQQAPPSMEFSRQEDWSGLPFPSLVPDCS